MPINEKYVLAKLKSQDNLIRALVLAQDKTREAIKGFAEGKDVDWSEVENLIDDIDDNFDLNNFRGMENPQRGLED